MVFGLFRPRWQHADAAVRAQAIAALPFDHAGCQQLARQDADQTVRIAALNRLLDIAQLQLIAKADHVQAVREAAVQRVAAIWCGKVEGAPALEVRLAWLNDTLKHAPLGRLAIDADEATLRAAALQQIHDDHVLIDIALTSIDSELRQIALNRITHHAALARLLKDPRGRDKRILKQARERLEKAQQEEKQQQLMQQLIASYVELAERDPLAPLSHLSALDKQWQQAFGEQEQAAKEQAKAQFLTRYQHVSQQQGQLRQLLADALALVDVEPTVLAETLPLLLSQWQALDPAPDRYTQERWDSAIKPLQHVLKQADKLQSVKALFTDALQMGESLLNQTHALSAQQVQRYKEQLKKLPELNATDELVQQQHRILEQLKQRLERQDAVQSSEKDTLIAQIELLEKQIEEGQVTEALQTQQQLQAALQAAISLQINDAKSLRRRLNALAPQLSQLKNWRRWGVTQNRDQLCAAAELLATGIETPQSTVESLKKLRDQWKALDKQGGPSGKAVWARFDQACHTAHQYIRTWRNQQNQLRQHHALQAQHLLSALQAELVTIEWEQVTRAEQWRKLEDLRRDFLKCWRTLGVMARQERQQLEDKLTEILAPLDQRIKQQKQLEKRRREALIAQLESALTGLPLDEAVSLAKGMSTQWQPVIRLRRHEEDALWKRFRRAMEAVFARREAEQHAADTERDDNLVKKQVLIQTAQQAIQQVKADDIEQIQPLTQQLQQWQQEWDDVGPIPKAQFQPLQKAWQKIVTDLQTSLLQLQQAEKQHYLDVLLDVGQQLAQLELAALTQQAIDLPEITAINLLRDTHKQAQQERVQRLQQVIAGDTNALAALRELAEAATQMRHQWCLQREVILGVHHPEINAAERMAAQVDRLQQGLSERQRVTQTAELEKLNIAWAIAVTATPDQAERLALRFQMA